LEKRLLTLFCLTQEKYRYGIEEGFYGGFIFNQTISSDIDAATVRETYTFAFAEAVRRVFLPLLPVFLFSFCLFAP